MNFHVNHLIFNLTRCEVMFEFIKRQYNNVIVKTIFKLILLFFNNLCKYLHILIHFVNRFR